MEKISPDQLYHGLSVTNLSGNLSSSNTQFQGTSIRAHLAETAMASLIILNNTGHNTKRSLCKEAVEYADALIEELNKQ